MKCDLKVFFLLTGLVFSSNVFAHSAADGNNEQLQTLVNQSDAIFYGEVKEVLYRKQRRVCAPVDQLGFRSSSKKSPAGAGLFYGLNGFSSALFLSPHHRPQVLRFDPSGA